MTEEKSIFEATKIVTFDHLKLKDPTVFTDKKGHHIIGLSKLKSGNNNMAYYFTENFKDFNGINLELIVAEKECSIWSGCVFEDNGKYHVFYTIRSVENGYWAKQTIKRLETEDFKIVDFKNLNLTPELADNNKNIFQYKPQKDSYTVHSWRDPFVFKYDNKFYMLVAAKTNRTHFNASIALLVSEDLDEWSLLNSNIIPNDEEYEELELPSIIINNSNEVVLMTCCNERNDYIETGKNGYNPLNNEKQNVEKIIRKRGMLLTFKASNMENALLGQFHFDTQIKTPSNFYAGRYIPVQNAIIGHDENNLSMMLIQYESEQL